MRVNTAMNRPNVCGARRISVNVNDCDLWLIPIQSLENVINPTHNNAWILPDNTVWVRNNDNTRWVLVNTGGADFNGVVELSNEDEFVEIGGVNPVRTINLNQQALNNKIGDHIEEHDNNPLAHPILRHQIEDLNTRIDHIVGMGKKIGTYEVVADLPVNMSELAPVVPTVNDWAIVGRDELGFYYAYVITNVEANTGVIEWQYGWRMSADVSNFVTHEEFEAHTEDERLHTTFLPVNHFTADVLGAQYPLGLSLFSTNADVNHGFPNSIGVVETINVDGAFRIIQRRLTMPLDGEMLKMVRNWRTDRTINNGWSTWRVEADQNWVENEAIVARANQLHSTRLINGAGFDGTSDITTEYWGRPRNIRIGESNRSVDGSIDLHWSLKDIGAAPATAVADTGWVDITPRDGQSEAIFIGDLQARRVGDMVNIRGRLFARMDFYDDTTLYTSIYTQQNGEVSSEVPEQFRPTGTHVFDSGTHHNGEITYDVGYLTDGDIRLFNIRNLEGGFHTGNQITYFFNVTYLV